MKNLSKNRKSEIGSDQKNMIGTSFTLYTFHDYSKSMLLILIPILILIL